MYNVRTFRKMIQKLEVNETFYFNSIAGTVSMIEYLRELIQSGKVVPVGDELAKMIKPEYHYKFYSGESIAPQMTYKVLTK